ncbi:MAG TPA: hypothetical protein VGC87_14610 [Pyrinomonadaceae bacterium]|jgi:hypothetical protein
MSDNGDKRDGRVRAERQKLTDEEIKKQRGEDPKSVRHDPKPHEPARDPAKVKEVRAFIDRRLKQKRRVRQDGLWPYLLIRAVPGDHGVRPLSVPFWESPDIIIVPGVVSAYDGVSATLSPQVGVPHTIFVHVWNLGRLLAVGVKLRVYWVNPSLSLDDPAHPPNLIGSMYFDLPDRQNPDCHKLLRLPATWTPVMENGGHECLLAKVTCFADGAEPGLDARADRHVGQRNLHLMAAQEDLSRTLASLRKTLPRDADLQILHAMRDLQPALLVHQPTLFGRLKTPATLPRAAFALADGTGHLGALLRGASGVDRFVPASVIGPMFKRERIEPQLMQNAQVRELSKSREPVQDLVRSLGVRELTAVALAKQLGAVPGEGHMLRIQAVRDGALLGGYTLIVQAEAAKTVKPPVVKPPVKTTREVARSAPEKPKPAAKSKRPAAKSRSKK